MLKKGRLAIHKMKIVRLIKVKSKVNVNVTKCYENSQRNKLNIYSLCAIKRFLRKKFANYIDPYNHKNYKIKEKKRLNKVQFTCRQ